MRRSGQRLLGPTGLAVLLLVVSVSVGEGATIRVPADEPTIADGVAAAWPADTVLVAPGVYFGQGNALIELGGDVVLISEDGPDHTVIELLYTDEWAITAFGGGSSGPVIDGFTIQNGYFESGGSALQTANYASLLVHNCYFENNVQPTWYYPAYGGAASVRVGCTAIFENCVFSQNRVWYCGDVSGPEVGGGAVAFLAGASGSFQDCTFIENAAVGFFHSGAYHQGLGGAIYQDVYCDVLISDCTFYMNETGSIIGGAAVYCTGDSLTIEKTIIAFGERGGGIMCDGFPIIETSCSNIFGNEGGDWTGCVASQLGQNGNISLDPQFCNAPNGDFTLDAASPCAPANSGGCGLIGAWPVACGTVSVEPPLTPPRTRLLSVHPNPVLSSAEFTLDGAQHSTLLEIYDPVGRLVDELRLNGTTTWVPSKSMRSGVYFARLRDGRDSQVVRFIVLR